MEELTIRVDPRAAAIYRNADEQQRHRFDMLLSFKLACLAEKPTERDTQRLLSIMDEISEEAQRRGLTPEILESILNDEQ